MDLRNAQEYTIKPLLRTISGVADISVWGGTGQAFQVPTLVNIAARAPFMHDGCAPTLHDRFNAACGGGDAHGVTSQLSQSDIDDLVAYLETL